jgi:hypothetical protein
LPAKTAPKKSAAKSGPRKLARWKSPAKSKPSKVSPRKSAAKKLPAKVTAKPVKAGPPPAKRRDSASELIAKLRATIAKQKVEIATAKYRPPKLPPPPKTPAKPKARSRVFIIKVADKQAFDEVKKPGKPRVRVSSHGNKKATDFAKVFAGAFKSSLRSTPFEDPDDAPVSRFGISFRVPDINNMSVAKGAMREWLNSHLPPHASAHIVEEETGIVVHLNFGKYDDYSTAGEAERILTGQKRFILEAMDKTRDFTDYAEDYVWFAEWDWDEDITAYE